MKTVRTLVIASAFMCWTSLASAAKSDPYANAPKFKAAKNVAIESVNSTAGTTVIVAILTHRDDTRSRCEYKATTSHVSKDGRLRIEYKPNSEHCVAVAK
jgi:hypothetical protein